MVDLQHQLFEERQFAKKVFMDAPREQLDAVGNPTVLEVRRSVAYVC